MVGNSTETSVVRARTSGIERLKRLSFGHGDGFLQLLLAVVMLPIAAIVLFPSVAGALSPGTITTVVGGGSSTADPAPALSALLDEPTGGAFDSAGNMVFVDEGDDLIRMLPAESGTYFGRSMTAGDVYTIAGVRGVQGYPVDGAPALGSELCDPIRVSYDSNGNLLLSDGGPECTASPSGGEVSVIAAHTGTYYGMPMTANDIYTVAGSGSESYSGDGGPALSAGFTSVNDVYEDSHGNLVISDEEDSRVRVVAESTGTFYGVSMTSGDVYTIASASNGLKLQTAIVPDANGNVLIANTNDLVAPSADVDVLAASTGTFYGQSMTVGHLYTIAGLTTAGCSTANGVAAVDACLESPTGVAVDQSGNVIEADNGSDLVRVIAATTGTFYGQSMTANDIYTIAGNGTTGPSGNNGPATSAGLTPYGIAFGPGTNLYVFAGQDNDIWEMGGFGPTSITATDGTPQSAPTTGAFSTPLQATVTNASDQPVPNVSVTFTAPTSGASGTFVSGASTTVLTDTSGVATAPTFTANSTQGSYTVDASVGGLATPATFSLSNGPAADLSVTATAKPAKKGQAKDTIIVKNNGPDTATSVVVTSEITSSSFVSAKAKKCTSVAPTGGAQGAIECRVTSMASGASKTIKLTIRGSSGEAVSITTTASSAVGDPNPANNRATASTSYK